MPTLSIDRVTKNPAQRPLALENQAVLRTHQTSAEQAQGGATDFLLDHIGNQLLAGQPHSMLSATQATWLVPIHLAHVHTGPLGTVGVIAVDEERGQVVTWTPVDQSKAATRTLRAAKAPSLPQDFQPRL